MTRYLLAICAEYAKYGKYSEYVKYVKYVEYGRVVSVKPMLDVAEITSVVVYTEYSGHARDYVQECKDLYKYSAIMTVSGNYRAVSVNWRSLRLNSSPVCVAISRYMARHGSN